MGLAIGKGEGVNISEPERWAMLLGGSALLLNGLLRRSPGGWGLALLGGGLIGIGATRQCPVYRAADVSTAEEDQTDSNQGAAGNTTSSQGIWVEKSVTINRPAEELYRFWRDFENLPRFMKHLESVLIIDDKRSHWVVRAPIGRTVEWDAEITADEENEMITWQSLENADVESAGLVRFQPLSHDRGTQVDVLLRYSPPGGAIGATIAKFFGEEPSQQIREDLRRFKNLMEAGEIPTTKGQPAGRRMGSGLLWAAVEEEEA